MHRVPALRVASRRRRTLAASVAVASVIAFQLLLGAGPASATAAPSGAPSPSGASAPAAGATAEPGTSAADLVIPAPTPVPTMGRVAADTEMAPLRDAWIQQLDAGWKNGEIYVADSVTAGVTAAQRSQIEASIAKAKAAGVATHVALLPEPAGDDVVVVSRLDGPALGALQKVAETQGLSGIFSIMTPTDYGRWSSETFTIDKDGIPSGSLIGFGETAPLDEKSSGAVGSYSIDAALASIQGKGLPKPDDAQRVAGIDGGKLDYWMDYENGDPNTLVAFLVLIATAGSLLFVMLRGRGRARLVATTIPESLRETAVDGIGRVRKLGEAAAEAALPDLPPGTAGRDDDDARFAARARLEHELDALAALPGAEDVSDPRELAAAMALAARIRHLEGVVRGAVSGPPRAVCFYNPLHTLAVERLTRPVSAKVKEPAALETRQFRPGVLVPVCARCAAAHDEGRAIDSLNVRRGLGVVPYWSAGDRVYAATGFGAFGDLATAVLEHRPAGDAGERAGNDDARDDGAETVAAETAAAAGKAGTGGKKAGAAKKTASGSATDAKAGSGIDGRRAASGFAIVLASILVASAIGVVVTGYLMRSVAPPGVADENSASTIPDFDRTRVDRLAAELKASPVAVDPDLLIVLPQADQEALKRQIAASGKPIYVVGASSNAYDESRGDTELFARRVANALGDQNVVIAVAGRDISVAYQKADVEFPDEEETRDPAEGNLSGAVLVSRQVDELSRGTWSAGSAAHIDTPGEYSYNDDDGPKILLFGYPLSGQLTGILIGGLVGLLIGGGAGAAILGWRGAKTKPGGSGGSRGPRGGGKPGGKPGGSGGTRTSARGGKTGSHSSERTS